MDKGWPQCPNNVNGNSGWSRYHDTSGWVKSIEIAHANMIQHYMLHTGMSKKTVEKDMLAKDTYYTPDEAIKYGLCDRIGAWYK